MCFQMQQEDRRKTNYEHVWIDQGLKTKPSWPKHHLHSYITFNKFMKMGDAWQGVWQVKHAKLLKLVQQVRKFPAQGISILAWFSLRFSMVKPCSIGAKIHLGPLNCFLVAGSCSSWPEEPRTCFPKSHKVGLRSFENEICSEQKWPRRRTQKPTPGPLLSTTLTPAPTRWILV